MNGGQLQEKVIQTGHLAGWRFAHFRSVQARTSDGDRWMTPVAGDGKGFPDLLCVHPKNSRLIFREIKGDRESMRPDQIKWRDWLIEAGCDWDVWRPRDWDSLILPTLTFGRAR